jgi:hypothetical protein
MEGGEGKRKRDEKDRGVDRHAVQFPPGRDRPQVPNGGPQTAVNLLRHRLLTPGVLAADDYRGGVLRRELEDLLVQFPLMKHSVPAAVIQMLEVGGPEQQVKVMADLKRTEVMVDKQANRISELEEALLARSQRAVDLARITTLEDAIAQAETAARVDYQHYCQQEFELKLQIKSLSERGTLAFNSAAAMYTQANIYRREQTELKRTVAVAQAEVAAAQAIVEAAQAATAAAQAATAVAQAEAVVNRAPD